MTDTFAQAALDAATLRIQAAVGMTAERLVEQLGPSAASSVAERHALAALQTDLRLRLSVFKLDFNGALRDAIETARSPRSESRRSLQSTSWETLSLVADDEVDARVGIDRLSLEIAQDCEWEVRELDSYMAVLLHVPPEPERNPLRPEVVARALSSAIQGVTPDPPLRQLLARKLGHALAGPMHGCYVGILANLRERGVQANLAVRTVQGPGNELPWNTSGYQSAAFRHSGPGSGTGALGSTTGNEEATRVAYRPSGGSGSSHGDAGSSSMGFGSSGGRPGSAHGGHGHAGGLGGGGGAAAMASAAADAQMLEMLRRLAFVNPLVPDSGFAVESGTAERRGPRTGSGGPASSSGAGHLSSGNPAPSNLGSLGGLMAVNLIRQHRDELVRASTGALDHMVIDVVGAMFDHLLSDSKVPPQLARQIARLQMPVLRAALKDMGFFSSRRHPVRRFVNRVASLAAGYEDLEEGPGREFLDRVKALVQEIVEGDFDQMDIYESKLQAIETLILEQSRRDVGPHAEAAKLLDGKENQLRIQQRYMLALRGQLDPLGLPDYLRDFLSQVWSQVQVQASGPDGSPERLQRTQQTARDLVMSVQPKGEPRLRKAFLMQLPQLMKDLNEGLEAIRWPEPAKKAFFARLLPAHAESLKAAPPTDFEQRQFKFKLEQIAKVVIPTEKDLLASAPAPLPPPEQHAAPLQFSPEEVERTGYVEETAVDWDGKVDIDLGEASPSGTAAADLEAEAEVEAQAQQQAEAEGAPPTHGPQLLHHLQAGIAYRMHVEGRWQRVRLNWVSPGRAFFVFTHGKAHEKTISMTTRMLTRLCETERFRAYEQAELIERATARARKQLAQIGAASRLGSLGTRH